MALIKCPECGKEVSNRASACVYCGYPIAAERLETSQTNETDFAYAPKTTAHKRPKKKKAKPLGLIIAVVLIFAVIIALNKEPETNAEEDTGRAYQTMLNESKNNIAPYLEQIPCRPDEESGKILLPSELLENIDNVEFLGLTGSVSYKKNDYGVINNVYWASHDFFTFEEHQEFALQLEDYFGMEAEIDHYLMGEWTQKDYYWEDDTVPAVVVFYTSVRANHEEDTDRIEVYWDMDAEMPD